MLETWWMLLIVGTVVGCFIGFTGLGGGAIVVPILVLLYGLDQKSAQGTSLSIILSPLQLPAILKYGAMGLIQWKFLWFMGPGVLIGCFAGATIASAPWFPATVLRVCFGLLLSYIGAYTLFSFSGVKRGVVLALIFTIITGISFAVLRWIDQKARTEPPATQVAKDA